MAMGMVEQPPLNDAELSMLESFLDSQDDREGAMPLSAAHGFLTAVISGPELVMPSEWMSVIWGYPEFEDEGQALEVKRIPQGGALTWIARGDGCLARRVDAHVQVAPREGLEDANPREGVPRA